MSNASHDQNGIATLICLLNTDGATTQIVKVNPTNNALKISDAATGSDNGASTDKDGNRVPILYAVSNADGVTPVAIYADSSGNLLVKST